MTHILYWVLLFPLETGISVIYEILYSLLGNVGLSIIGVSLAVNVVCLPLYAVAERWQRRERETIKALTPRINSIKRSFHGDERHFILETYYRQNGYHPIYALRSSFGLLIQIPFFLAAYNVLKNIPSLVGVSFLGIPDLSKPDALLCIGGFHVSILPFIMTAVNVVASAIYAKGLARKEKIQLYAMALVFLALLYPSPSGLVFYWTINNLFSLAKNLFYRMKRPLMAFWAASTALFVVLFALLATFFHATWQALLGIGLITLIIALTPYFIRLSKKVGVNTRRYLALTPRKTDALFALSCLGIALFAGLVIPGNVIASSPQEFALMQAFSNPLTLLGTTALQALGLFFVYPLCVYLLFSRRVKAVLCIAFTMLFACALACAFAFQGDYGTVSKFLTFESAEILCPSVSEAILNGLAIAGAICAVGWLFASRKTGALIAATAILAVSFASITVIDARTIASGYSAISELSRAENKAFEKTDQTVYSLSPDKPNVIFIMIDRAIGSFVPYAFEDSPVVKKEFDGFTWYPNTASFGGHTIFGAPPLFGGYDYVPDELVKKTDKPLVEKNNEALTALPRAFSASGWKVTATDMPFANYSWVPDNSIFSGIPNVKAINLVDRYTIQWLKEKKGVSDSGDSDGSDRIIRNMLRFSVMKSAPVFLRSGIYQGGLYWNGNWNFRGNEYEFIKFYASLDYLPRLTDYASKDSNLLLIQNETPHERSPYRKLLPQSVTARFGNGETVELYEVNYLAYEALARFFAEMKSRGVYDNTRIIIASDHGFTGISWADRSRFPNSVKIRGINVGYYNPVLLFKDFGDRGALKTDFTFMTNADAPDLATKGGVIANPVNPWTGNPFAAGDRKRLIHITTSHKFNPSEHGKWKFSLRDKDFIWLHDSIFDRFNWETDK